MFSPLHTGHSVFAFVALLTSSVSQYFLCIFILSLFTYIYNQFTTHERKSRTSVSREPIMPQGSLPYLGQSLPFLLGPMEYIIGLWSKFQGMPVYLTFPQSKIYLAWPGEQVRALFRSSDAVPTPSLFDALKTFFGLPREDWHLFQQSSHRENKGGPMANLSDPSRQIMQLQRRDFLTFLSGDNLSAIMERFTDCFIRELQLDQHSEKEWTFVPDLYSFLGTRIFRAEVEALYGSNFFKVCPSLTEDFWTLYDAMPILAKKVPRWLSPSSYEAQRKMQANFSQWKTWCMEQCELGVAAKCSEDEPIWGTLYVRRMVERYQDLGLSETGVAAVMSGFLFVTVANSIPATIWMMLHVVMDGSLVARVQPEIDAAFKQNPNQVQMEKLMKATLLSSIYCETLRLRIAGTIGRTSSSELNLPGDWRIRPGIPVMSTNWLGGLDDSFWNTGLVLPDGTMQHPLNKFWAERFLEYPDDPMSGPLRKPDYLRHAHSFITARHKSRDQQAKLITSGLLGHWFPFGGGASKCPGEGLAKQTMLTAVALAMRHFDIELHDPSGAVETGSKHKTLPFGSHAFDRAVPIRIRRKRPVLPCPGQRPVLPPCPGPPPNRPLPPPPKPS